MCEGYWDARTRRWVSLEEIEESARETAFVESVSIPTIPTVELKRKPAVLLR